MVKTKTYNTNIPDMEGTILHVTNDYPLFTPDEEYKCAVRMQTGETKEIRKEARDEMVLHNMRLVISMAKDYSMNGNSMVFSDIIQEGILGLMTACSKYDYRLGYKFSTYATWWIRQSIARAFADKNSVIRTPVHVYEINQQIRKFIGNYVKVMGEEPKAELIADSLNINVKYVIMYFQQYTMTSSLDMNIAGADDGTMLDIIEDKNAVTPEQTCVENDKTERIMAAINSLPEKEAVVIKMRFGLDGYEPMTLEQVGAEFGFTRERARQIEVKGLNKLKRGKYIKMFEELR